jgi:intraflagellar transport protein 172
MHKNTTADLDEAVKTINKRNGPATESAVGTYRRLVMRLLSRSSKEETGGEHAAIISMLRDILYRLANQYRSQPIDKKLNAEMLEMLMAVHYQNMLYSAKTLGLKEIAAKCSITLLKYPNLIPHDKAFYQAGMACREQGNTNLSFLLLNRFVIILYFYFICIAYVVDARVNLICTIFYSIQICGPDRGHRRERRQFPRQH